MKTLKIYGASDDLIETSGIEGCDEFSNYSDSPYKGKLLVQVDHKTFGIHVIYDGQWVFAVVNDVDDEAPIEYPIRRTFGKDMAYSETLEIDVPDHSHLVYLKGVNLMDANTYQQEAKRTLIDAPDREIPAGELQMIWDVLAIAIEAGNLLEHLKKAIFHQHGVDYQYFADSLIKLADMAALQHHVPAPQLSGEEVMKLWNLAGLIGEAAEIGETITEDLGGIPFDDPTQSLKKELGDAE